MRVTEEKQIDAEIQVNVKGEESTFGRPEYWVQSEIILQIKVATANPMPLVLEIEKSLACSV
jgi:hypothetical protein